VRLAIRLLASLVLLSAVGSSAAFAEKKGCSEDLMRQAEAATDSLKSWELVYEFYQKFARCDDGGVAEGVSDGVAKLFADHWGSVAEFVTIANSDKNFEKFVLRHVDSTIDFEHDAPKIRENARLHCPVNLTSLCKDLLTRAATPRDMGPR